MTTPPGLTDNREPVPMQFEPGFFTEQTPRGAKMRWKDGDRVRFKNGLIQKIGGWVDAEVGGAEPAVQFHGLARRYHEWTSLDGQNWIAEGTNQKLYLIANNERFDITPIRRTVTLTNPFTTTMSSAVVTVTDPGHNARTGDFVRFSGASAVGGITIDGEYQLTILTGDTYSITHGTAASSGASGGGTVDVEYDISVGLGSNQPARGFGTCGFGEGTFGTPRGATCSGLVAGLRLWSLDNFGEDLIASPRGGAIYRWDRTLGTGRRAEIIAAAPPINERVLMSGTGGRIICLGAYDLIANTLDPMLIVAGEEEGLEVFRDTLPGEEENDVYTERASEGSKLITGLNTRSGTLIFSDTTVYILLPDPEAIFDLRRLAGSNSVIGPNAAIDINGVVYYMSEKKFMRFDGVLTEVPCTIWRHVFDNADATQPGFNEAQAEKTYAWHNEDFNEIWWLYPSGGATENDRAAVYNYMENLWFYLSINRTAAHHKHASYGVPIATDSNGVLYLHETGVNDGTEPMNEYAESFDSEVGPGKVQLHLSKIIPDMKRQVGTLKMLFKSKKRPKQAAYSTSGPYSFTPTTEEVSVRVRGRQVAVRMYSDETDTDWCAGDFTGYAGSDGER